MSFQGSKEQCLSPAEAKRFYDRFGSRQDWQAFYEDTAVNNLIGHAAFDSAHSVFEFGFGTGALAARLLQRHLPADAHYVGQDISTTMLALAQELLRPWSDRARVYQNDGSAYIPESDHSFDRFISTYVFDLLAHDFIDQVLSEAHRLLVPGGKLCLTSMTFGLSNFSRAVTWSWQRLWRLSPGLVGGCRPIELGDYLGADFWTIDQREAVTSWGITSEVVIASPR